MPAPIIAEYGYFLLSNHGKQASKAQDFKGLKDCIASIAAAYGLDAGSLYFKAYRAVRQCGMYCAPVFCTIVGQQPATNWRMLFVYQVGFQDTTPGLVPVEVISGGPVEKLPLEKLIEQAQGEQHEEVLPVRYNTYIITYSKRNQITGGILSTRHIVEVEAQNMGEAELKAHEIVSTGKKYHVYVHDVLPKQ